MTMTSSTQMIALYDGDDRDGEFLVSVGASLNLGANTLADVLHTFFLNVVDEE